MTRLRRRPSRAAVWCLAGSMGLVLLVVAPVRAQASGSRVTTATFAEQPGARPDFIFPLDPSRYFGPANMADFQYLMYRPLYWLGSGDSPTVDLGRSLAAAPVFSDGNAVVTIDLRPFRWSDGEAVSSRDVVFWLNLLHAEKANWPPYGLGSGDLPDDIAGVKLDSPTQLTLTLTAAVNRFWFADSELTQITPLPLAWDVTAAGAAPGSGHCSGAAFGTDDSACAAVYTFLANQAGYDPDDPSGPNVALGQYPKNPLWQVVDGPWRLAGISTGGRATLVANRSYSGPRRGNLGRFVEVPFPTAGAELAALSAGRLSYGYLSLDQVTGSTSDPQRAGSNASGLGSFTLTPMVPWALDYIAVNFNSTGDGGWAGLLLGQLYLRQAMQQLVDQPRIVAQVAHGYAAATYGPVPTVPANPFATGAERSNPYPYDPARARALLVAHGWRLPSQGAAVCTRPGTANDQCGGTAGRVVPAGTRLSFELLYSKGSGPLRAELEAERASWLRAGIVVTIRAAPASQVRDTATSCRTGCPWELADWGTGWLFSPGAYPLGDTLFASDAQYNAGSYQNPAVDAAIVAARNTPADLSAYESTVAQQLPVLFQPNLDQLVEVANSLRGATPPNVLLAVTPEDWRLSG